MFNVCTFIYVKVLYYIVIFEFQNIFLFSKKKKKRKRIKNVLTLTKTEHIYQGCQ